MRDKADEQDVGVRFKVGDTLYAASYTGYRPSQKVRLEKAEVVAAGPKQIRLDRMVILGKAYKSVLTHTQTLILPCGHSERDALERLVQSCRDTIARQEQALVIAQDELATVESALAEMQRDEEVAA